MQPYPWTVIVQKLDAGFLQGRHHLRERIGAGADGAGEGFHAPDGADGDPGARRQFDLLPSDKRACRA